MIRMTLGLKAALAALAFSAATAHADAGSPDSPTPLGWGSDVYYANSPFFSSITTWDEGFSVPNDPSETFDGAVQQEFGVHCCDNYHVTVEQDVSGNIPIGEQYNDFTMINFPGLGDWEVVYNDIGVTPEAFLATPFGDLNFPTAFVEAVGPTFFEPSAPWLEGLPAAILPAAELPGLAADVTSLLPGLL